MNVSALAEAREERDIYAANSINESWAWFGMGMNEREYNKSQRVWSKVCIKKVVS